MSISDMDENPEKENIQGVEIQLVKINYNRQKANCASLVRTQKGRGSALPIDPEEGRADKQKINNVDP